jgi:hypothetical protein
VRRKIRVLLNAAAALSLLLGTAAIVLWILGYSKSYWAGRLSPPTLYEIGVSRGELYVHADRTPRPFRTPAHWLWQTGPAVDILKEFAESASHEHGPTAGFFYHHFDAYGESETWLALPMTFMVALLGGLPLLAVTLHLRRRRRAAAGHCRSCGYDLRATSDRCPECGRVPD